MNFWKLFIFNIYSKQLLFKQFSRIKNARIYSYSAFQKYSYQLAKNYWQMYLTAVVDLFVCMFSTGFRFFSCTINLVYTCIHLPFVIWYFLHLVHISKTFMIISKTTANSICQMQHFYMLSCCQHALHAFSLKGGNKNEFLHPWKSSRHKSIYKWADFLFFSAVLVSVQY